jgi:hypothetical protein
MKQEHKPQYKVIKTEEFIKNLNDLSVRYGRMTELANAIEWALARKPHHFNNLANDFYFWITEELMNHDFPVVKILYRIIENDSSVILLTIEER